MIFEVPVSVLAILLSGYILIPLTWYFATRESKVHFDKRLKEIEGAYKDVFNMEDGQDNSVSIDFEKLTESSFVRTSKHFGRVLWSPYFQAYIVVVSYFNDDNWYFVIDRSPKQIHKARSNIRYLINHPENKHRKA